MTINATINPDGTITLGGDVTITVNETVTLLSLIQQRNAKTARILELEEEVAKLKAKRAELRARIKACKDAGATPVPGMDE